MNGLVREHTCVYLKNMSWVISTYDSGIMGSKHAPIEGEKLKKRSL